MKNPIRSIFLIFVLLTVLLSGCAPAPPPIPPTFTPSPIPPTFTPEPTATNTPVPPSPTPTATPLPICNPNASIKGASNEDMPEYLDILNVSSTLDGTTLTVVFTLQEIPDEITINSDTLQQGQYEIAWGVAIDTDNNPDTGGAGLLQNSGYGYEYSLQAFNIKFGNESTGSVQNLFQNHNSKVWAFGEDGKSSTVADATFDVKQEAKTITLKADIPEITEDSYLHFFTYYGIQGVFMDEICQR